MKKVLFLSRTWSSGVYGDISPIDPIGPIRLIRPIGLIKTTLMTKRPSKPTSNDTRFMRMAIREAMKGVGHTSPNPAVGAVIVQNGRAISKGWHRAAGCPHAEIEALASLKNATLAKGATIYVTLEPCCTHGRTGACTDALIKAGVKRVVFGATDPNPAHAGRAIPILKKAGLQVACGVLGDECTALNPGFNHWITTGLPLVIAKAGLSLDGRLTRPPGEGQWLTGKESRADAMRLRAQVDAIIIGAGTLRADNPKLTIRGVPGFEKKQPWRVVVARKGSLPEKSHLFTDKHRRRTLIYRGKTLRQVLADLGKRGCTSVMIEGGGTILGAALDAKLVDKIQFYIAPLLCGGPDVIGGKGAASLLESAQLKNVSYIQLGSDIRVTADVI